MVWAYISVGDQCVSFYAAWAIVETVRIWGLTLVRNCYNLDYSFRFSVWQIGCGSSLGGHKMMLMPPEHVFDSL